MMLLGWGTLAVPTGIVSSNLPRRGCSACRHPSLRPVRTRRGRPHRSVLRRCGASLKQEVGDTNTARSRSQPPGCLRDAPSADSLHAALRASDGFDGDVGVYVHHVQRDQRVEIRADEVFPTASMIKVPILGALFDRIDNGELGYHDKLTYTKDRLYAGEDLLGSFADQESITLDQLAFLMITTSDNTASLWCQSSQAPGARSITG